MPRKASRKLSAAVIPDGTHSSNAANILAHEKKDCSPEEHRATLLKAFEEMDEDHSGQIDVTELGAMLKAQGHELEEDELKMVMSHLDADGDGDTLSFEEFMTVMNDLEHGAGLADIASHFSSEMTSLVGLAAAAKPIWEQLEERHANGEAMSKWQQFQISAGRVLDGSLAQVLILVLIVLDVLCVICELLMLHTMGEDCVGHCIPLDAGGSSRMLGGAFAPKRDQEALTCVFNGDDPHVGGLNLPTSNIAYGTVQQHCVTQFSKVQYDWNLWLHNVSVGILAIFGMQLFLLMLVYQVNFFKSTAYVMDSIVVGTALVLENLSNASEGGLFIVLLSWRVLRIVHGIASSVEISGEMKERAVDSHGFELAEEHEKKTTSIYEEVCSHMTKLQKRKCEVGDMVTSQTTAQSSEELAKDYLELCDMVESVHQQLASMKSKIAETKEHLKHEDVSEKLYSTGSLKKMNSSNALAQKKASLDKSTGNTETIGGPSFPKSLTNPKKIPALK